MGAQAVKKRSFFHPVFTPEPITWMLVAHQGGMKIFSKTGRHRQLLLVETWERPEARLKSRDIVSDRPGQSFHTGSPERHPYSTEQAANEHLSDQFAKRLSLFLQKAFGENRFDRLVLVAEPRFLGKLRKVLPVVLKNRLIAVLDKQLMGLTNPKLMEYLTKMET